jgi:hypothetical protein
MKVRPSASASERLQAGVRCGCDTIDPIAVEGLGERILERGL